MAYLLDVPREVVYRHVLPRLQFNDLLRLRRVCKSSKTQAEDYLANKSTKRGPLNIFFWKHGTDSNLQNILDIGFAVPVTSIDIFHHDEDIWGYKLLKDFLAKYGNKINRARIELLKIPFSSDALFFFESLPNLQHLTVSLYMYSAPEDLNSRQSIIPECLKNLKTLFVRIIDLKDMRGMDDKLTPSLLLFRRLVVTNIKTLMFLRYPVCTRSTLLPDMTSFIINILPKAQGSLKYLDLETNTYHVTEFFDLENHYRQYQLLEACNTYGVKILNLDAKLTEDVLQLKYENLFGMVLGPVESMLANVLVSINGLREPICMLELPQLERIDITNYDATVDNVTLPNSHLYLNRRTSWHNLKVLKLLINKKVLEDGKPAAALLQYFFQGIRREKLQKLKLELKKFAFPRARDVWTSCPNLTKLNISNWHETNKAISKLWLHLPLLETLKLKDCTGLGNVAFVGKDVNNPTFLKLKHLKSLTLDSLLSMPKISDTLFKLVIKHMPLKQLQLEGFDDDEDDLPKLKNVTVSGIRELLDGVFAKTIEVFYLDDIPLQGVSEEEISTLEKEFRSSHMK